MNQSQIESAFTMRRNGTRTSPCSTDLSHPSYHPTPTRGPATFQRQAMSDHRRNRGRRRWALGDRRTVFSRPRPNGVIMHYRLRSESASAGFRVVWAMHGGGDEGKARRDEDDRSEVVRPVENHRTSGDESMRVRRFSRTTSISAGRSAGRSRGDMTRRGAS